MIIVKQTLVATLFLFAVASFVSCEEYVWDPPKIDLTTPVSFKIEIYPIFSNNCSSCHKSGNLNFSSLSTAWTSINKPQYLTPTNPESSLIYTKLTSGFHETKCSIEDRNKIYTWIKQGALNDNE